MSKYGDDYWTIDKRIERAARPEHFQKLPYSDFRLNLADCERLNTALRLLRERETMAGKGLISIDGENYSIPTYLKGRT